MSFVYEVEIDVGIKPSIKLQPKCPQGIKLQFWVMFKENKWVLLCVIKLTQLAIKWRLIKMLWSLLICLQEGKCASFPECCFSLMEGHKTRKAQAPEHKCTNKHRLSASIRCKLILEANQKHPEPVLWFAHLWDALCSAAALCEMSAMYRMLLLGFTVQYCKPLLQDN